VVNEFLQLKASLPLFENVLDISLSVHNGDDLKRGLLWPINDDIVGIPAQRPETKQTGCKVRAGVTARRSFGKNGASIEDGLFYAIGGVLCCGPRCKPRCRKYRLWREALEHKRSSLFMQTPTVFHLLNIPASLRAVDQFAPLSL
jgi:hypothetical protein